MNQVNMADMPIGAFHRKTERERVGGENVIGDSGQQSHDNAIAGIAAINAEEIDFELLPDLN